MSADALPNDPSLVDCHAPPGYHAKAPAARKPPSHLVARKKSTHRRLFKTDPPVEPEDLCDYPVLGGIHSALGMEDTESFTTQPLIALEEPEEPSIAVDAPEAPRYGSGTPLAPFPPYAPFPTPVLYTQYGFTPPVPEPSTWFLLITGLAAVAFARRKRK